MSTLSYRDFNNAIAEAYFNPSRAGTPVYLDLDNDSLNSAAASLDLSVDEFHSELRRVVRGRLPIHSPGHGMLSEFEADLDTWMRSFRRALNDGEEPTAPPVIALLAVFTQAAEQMGDTAQSDLHTNAYYPRLFRILDIPESDENRFHTAFQRHTEGYWAALTAWLEAFDGGRGLPTAVALSHRYIGLPVSQAVVREAERHQLMRMFEETGLSAGSAISAVDMEATLDDWITTADPAPQRNFSSLWKSAARDAVIDVAVNELAGWDGVPRYRLAKRERTSGGGAAALQEIRLALEEDFGFFGNEYRFAAIAPVFDTDEEPTLETARGELQISHRPIGSGFSAIDFKTIGLSAAHGLAGVLRITDGAGHKSTRPPRKVVPLAWDATLGLHVEVDRMPIGDTAALLVDESEGMADQAAEMLTKSARPGFDRVSGGRGVPYGWSLFTEVTMLQPPTSPRPGLEALLPRLSIQMSFTGGFRMPGRLQRWSTLDLPELTVVSDDDRPVEVEIQRRELGEKHERVCMHSGPPPVIVKLSDHVDADGDYDITLKRDGRSIQSSTVRARSAAARDQSSWANVVGILHDAADPLWPMRARAAAGEPIVDGAQTFVEGTLIASERMRTVPVQTSGEAPASSATERVELPAPEPTSCILTGRHHWRIPTARPGSTGAYTIGECGGCGLRKRYPTDPWRARKKKPQQAAAPRPVQQFAPAQAVSNWRAALDAIAYLGAGSASELSTIARQLENSATFEHHFVRTLEALGHLETQRDDGLRITAFEVASTALAGVADGYLATGSWSDADLRQACESAGAADIEHRDVAPVISLPVLAAAQAEELPEETIGDAVVVDQAGWSMLLALPQVVTLAEAMDVSDSPLVTGRTERFVSQTARWERAERVDQAGLFRIRSFGSAEYFLRTAADVAAGAARPLSNSELGKYILAAWEHVGLARYDRVSRELVVPLGSPLPGLYERAAVLASGREPRPVKSDWTLRYAEISEAFAEQMIVRLM